MNMNMDVVRLVLDASWPVQVVMLLLLAASFVSWRITPVDAYASTLRIAVYPHVLQRIPVAIRWLPHLARVRPRLKAYLSSVVRGFEWYITKGEPVPRNQFGAHPWFS